jgi:nicotinamide-nucleotide amidase
VNDELDLLAMRTGDRLMDQGLSLVTAESCTGGWIASCMTSVAGSSAWFDCGFVTYSNQSKSLLLGVDPDLISAVGAVSEEVVRAMVMGALERSRADLAVAVSGIAGPGGGSEAKPVGLVWLAWQRRAHSPITLCCQFQGNRTQVRRQAVVHALEGLQALL